MIRKIARSSAPGTLCRSIFIDSSNVDEIKKWNELGIIDGVTTNQFIMAKDGIKPQNYQRVIRAICREVGDKPVSVELTNSLLSPASLLKEALAISRLSPNIVVKVPLIPNATKSLWVIRELIKKNIAVNVTAMMTFEQLVMAILATRHSKKIAYVSFFWGRSIEDQAKYRSRSDFMASYPRVGIDSPINRHPQTIIEQAVRCISEGGYRTVKVIAGSIRTAVMAGEALAAGAHVVTIAPDILLAMLFSQRSVETIAQFDEAWIHMHTKKDSTL